MHSISSYSSRRAGIILATILVFASCLTVGTSLNHNHAAYAAQTAADPPSPSGRAALHEIQDAFTSIADDVLPSVVSITSKRTVTGASQGLPDDEFFRSFPFQVPQPGTPQKRQEVAYGSGVIIRGNGYILTNDHVVAGADKVTVKLSDGREFEGKVSEDPRSDLAVVKIDATNLPAADLGDSSKVKAGMWAIAMGSPFELEQTVTVGVISGIHRQEAAGSSRSDVRFYPDLLQTDASINPGNSGGPLVNIDGQIIGINTLIRSGGSAMLGTQGNIGIGFAIPINTARSVLEQLIAHGKVVRGYLGLVPGDLTPRTQDSYGVKEGALVRSVEVGSPADKAGVRVEDVIVEFDGKKIRNELDLRSSIAAAAPGKQVPMVLVRDKKEKTVTVTIGQMPQTVASAPEAPKPTNEKLGFAVANITPEAVSQYSLEKGLRGVVVTGVVQDSPADQAGLEAGLVITSVNRNAVANVAQFNAATKNLKPGDSVRLVAQTNERRALIEFTLE